jgi:peptide/nickel transport system substrate-binding protein
MRFPVSMPSSRPRLHHWLRAAIVGVALGMAVLTGLSGPALAQEKVLRVAMTAGDIPDWTGHPDQGAEGQRFVGFSLYDSFLNWDLTRSDREAVPTAGLASKWYPDPTNTRRWIFELRRDVKFHDGCPWNAEAALWNIARITDDKVPQFNPVHFARNRSRTVNVAGAVKIDDYTIAVDTKVPESVFPYNMAVWFVISKCALEKAGYDYKVYAQSPQGSGPYKFGSVVPRERLELVRNPDYWNPARTPKHDRMVLIPMPEATTRAAALLSGQVDFIEAPSPDTLPRLKAAGMRVTTLTYPHNWHYQFNFQRGAFKDIKVRQAANHAMDRKEMVEMLGGIAEASEALFTPYQAIYGKPKTYPYDPKKATALLKEAGCYPCAITVGISTSGSGQMQPLPMNELVKAQLEAVGFRVKFEVLDWNALLDLFFKGWERAPTYDAINISLGSVDPVSGMISHFSTARRAPGGLNWGWFDNKEFDELADKAMNTFEPEKSLAMFTRLHEIVSEQAGRLFIVHDLNPRAMSPKVKGFVPAQSWMQDFVTISLD